MTEYKAFFYGTLMAPEVLNRVIYGYAKRPSHEPERFVVLPAILHDHRRHRVGGADYPAIIPAKGSSVRGTFVTGLIRLDIKKLDMFEGGAYERQFVKPRLLKASGVAATGEGNVEGEEVEAQTYIWIQGEKYLEANEWDFEEFQKEKMRSWVAGDEHEEFAELKEAFEDGTGGRGVNGHITQALNTEHAKGKDKDEADEPIKSAV